jgi:hypothetical protein
VGYAFDAVAAFAKRREFSGTHGSSNLRGQTLYYFLQVFECAVRFLCTAEPILAGLWHFLPYCRWLACGDLHGRPQITHLCVVPDLQR